MVKRRADPEIGLRMSSEIMRLFGSPTRAARFLQCGKNTIYEWANGVSPSAIMLNRIDHFGGDIYYVVTGRRMNDG